jgi:hypothetical protein
MLDGEGPCLGRDRGTSGSDRGIASEVTPGPKSDQRTGAAGAGSHRKRLPNRRVCETQAFEHAGALYRLSVGFYENGQPGELFLNGEHSNSAIDTIMSDAAIAISFALQYGADLAAVKSAMKRNSAGEPSSPIGAALDRITS